MYRYSRFVAASIALGLLSLVQGQTLTQNVLSDPRASYSSNFTLPSPGFPVLQSTFDPRPDCGETSYTGTGRLQGRRALITGGDSGIGRAVAIAFAREGADVVINYLPEEEPDAAEVVSVIEATTNSRIFTVPGDIRNETFCNELVHQSAELLGGLDILINNAGYGRGSPNITALSTESFTRTIETNIFAPFYLTRAAVPLLPPGSSIVFTSSAIFENPPYRLADYAATKAFLLTFSRALGVGLMASSGIKVNAVRPAIILTPFLPSQGQTTEMARQAAATLPLGRIQQPIEIAPQFVALVGDDGSYATGGID